MRSLIERARTYNDGPSSAILLIGELADRVEALERKVRRVSAWNKRKGRAAKAKHWAGMDPAAKAFTRAHR